MRTAIRLRPTLDAIIAPAMHGIAVLMFITCWASSASAEPTEVVASWDFGAEESTPLQSHGGVHRDQPGPRPPVFPDFDPQNTAVKLDGAGARFTFQDPGPNSPFDFQNGDAITLEAWVMMDDLRAHENLYIIGKGRTGAAGFAADNQNWALRLREVAGQACVSFLFATPRASGAPKTDSHWHRWTTRHGFAPDSGWHHVAVTYRFGDPESVRGWIDGVSQPGAWDMGGPTTQAPVVDNDAIWIGSSQGGHAGNSFRGWLDALAIHRGIVDDDILKRRFRRVGPATTSTAAAEVEPEMGDLPSGRVLATFHEGLPAHDRWLKEGESWPPETDRWLGTEFLLTRIPVRYDAWGVRESWQAPVLTRIAADVSLEPGRRRFVLRARGLSRLWVNGQVIARTKPLLGSPNGEEAITPLVAPPHPGLRLSGYRQQEVFGEAMIGAEGTCRVILETIVGGKAFRPEPGELCVAVETSDGQSFELLQAAGSESSPVPLTDADVNVAMARFEQVLREQDDRTRRQAAAQQDPFWQQRHALARQWSQDSPSAREPNASRSPTTGSAETSTDEKHPIDAFLIAKIDRALASAAQTPADEAEHFHQQVLPILREHCFRCHGEKENGGLRLNSRQAALQGGDSEAPAVVPGDVANSALLTRVQSADESERMPPTGTGLTPEQIATLENWVRTGAAWPAPPLAAHEVALPPVVDDAAFLRRLALDTVGVPPTEAEVREFMADASPDKRQAAIERFIADERWADHWMSYWQDVLAENPTLINSTLNSTGPFRWFLYDALRDDKPLDRLVTELIMMRGGAHDGGSAGFALAAENDAPLAAKAHILASAFLGIELQCARCHDSPYHSTLQKDLYALSAMLQRKAVTVPKTSSVPVAFFEKQARESLIRVTLSPNEPVASAWPFAAVTGSVDDASLDALLQNPEDSRERLAALITSPRNTRFSQVVANRVWRRLMGAGLVEPPHDWEGHAASHPELLAWLAEEFVLHGYDLKHLARRILSSQAYQREAVGYNLDASPELRFFAAPERRRLTAEQVVDTLFAATGVSMDVEELTFDPDGRRPANNRLSLGVARRAWMFASLANERDRPSLTLPRAQAVSDVLEAFGWTGARQTPRTDREVAPNVLQSGVLSNSTLSVWLTRAAYHSPLAELAIHAESPESLVDSLFLRCFSRLPSAEERPPLVEALSHGFAKRIVPEDQVQEPTPWKPLSRVTWSNHLNPMASTIQLEVERRVRSGPPVDSRLRAEWREVYEDVVWSLINSREFVWSP